VHLKQDATFLEQRERFRLRFTCERCALFDEATQRCAHGFPTEPHRDARYEDDRAPLVFCKHFELG
jgi:hypothetical protein